MIDFHFDGVQLSKVVCHHLYGFCVFHVLLLQDLIVDVLFDPNLIRVSIELWAKMQVCKGFAYSNFLISVQKKAVPCFAIVTEDDFLRLSNRFDDVGLVCYPDGLHYLDIL